MDQVVKISDDNYLEMIGTFIVLLENTIDFSTTYVIHAGRNQILVEDVKLALKLETVIFCRRRDVIQKAKQIIKDIRAMENFKELEDEDLPEELVDKFTKSECTCDVCKAMNSIETIWESWRPETPLEHILFKRTNQLC